jgi:S-adenosylmethionine:tRNA ribosyltransferase-isomerase
MHSERIHVPLETLEALTRGGKARYGSDEAAPRVVAVGTTTVRTLESLPQDLTDLLESREAFSGSTELLIAPPFRFKHVDALLTNFHLPRSTLLALVAALVGLERLKALYAEAVRLRYRFYSYGDAMLILP